MRIQRTVLPALLLLSSLALLSACDGIRFWERGRQAHPAPSIGNKDELLNIRKRAAALQTAIEQLPRRDVQLTIGDTVINAALYGDGQHPVLVDEQWSNSIGQSGRYRYYFEDGNLFHFYGRTSLTLNAGEAGGERADILLRLYFNAKGNMFEYEKKVGESSLEMTEDEMPAIMRRAEALRLLAYSDSSGAIDTVAFKAMLHDDSDMDVADKLPSGETLEPAAAETVPTSTTTDKQATHTEDKAQPRPAAGTTPAADGGKKTAEVEAKQKTGAASQTSSAPKVAAAPREDTRTSTPAAKQQESVTPPATKSTPATKQQESATLATKSAPATKSTPATQPVSATKPAPKVASAPKETPRAGTSVPAAKKSASPVPTQAKPSPAPTTTEVAADPGIPAHTHRMLPGSLRSARVQFRKGSSGVTLSAEVGKAAHQEYVLRARRGQGMSVTLDSENPDVYFRIFLNDGDISGERRSWTGTLPRYGDYHVVVYIKGAQTAGFTITIGIQ